MPDPNNLYLPEHNIVFQLICKAGNTSVKWRLLQDLLPNNPMQKEFARNPAAVWPFIRKEDIPDEALVIGFQRHPTDRIVSCWKNKVCGTFHQGFDRRHPGVFSLNMSFPAFLKGCSTIPDERADQHFRSQTYDLDLNRVDCMVRMEYITEDWEEVRHLCADRGLELKALEHRNSTSNIPTPTLGEKELDIIHTRWEDDFKLLGYKT